jgi:hypothetical protein
MSAAVTPLCSLPKPAMSAGVSSEIYGRLSDDGDWEESGEEESQEFSMAFG